MCLRACLGRLALAETDIVSMPRNKTTKGQQGPGREWTDAAEELNGPGEELAAVAAVDQQFSSWKEQEKHTALLMLLDAAFAGMQESKWLSHQHGALG